MVFYHEIKKDGSLPNKSWIGVFFIKALKRSRQTAFQNIGKACGKIRNRLVKIHDFPSEPKTKILNLRQDYRWHFIIPFRVTEGFRRILRRFS